MLQTQPFPDVVATAGAHLVTQPSTPFLPPFAGSEQWTLAVHRQLERLLFRQELRCTMYGRDNAEEWPESHTPQEMKEAWRERQRAIQWEIDHPGPATPDSAFDSYETAASGNQMISESVSREHDLDPRPNSKSVISTTLSDSRSNKSQTLTDNKGIVIQQPSPPSTQPTPSDPNVRGKKRKNRTSSSSNGDEWHQRKKRRRIELPESPDTSANVESKCSGTKTSQERRPLQTLERPTQDARSKTSLEASARDTTSLKLKRKRTDELENASVSSQQHTRPPHIKRKRTEEPDNASQSVEANDHLSCKKRKRVKVDIHSPLPSEERSRNRRLNEDLIAKQKTQSSAEFVQHLNDASFTKANKRQATSSKGKFVPLKEALSSNTAKKIAKKPTALKPSKTANKSLRSKLKRLAKTGIGAT